MFKEARCVECREVLKEARCVECREVLKMKRGVLKMKRENVFSGSRCLKVIYPTPPPNFKGLFKYIRQQKVKTFYNKLHSRFSPLLAESFTNLTNSSIRTCVRK